MSYKTLVVEWWWVSQWCQTCLSLLTLLQRPAYVGPVTRARLSHLMTQSLYSADGFFYCALIRSGERLTSQALCDGELRVAISVPTSATFSSPRTKPTLRSASSGRS